MDVDKVIKDRHSVRKFTSKKPRWQDIIDAIDAANQAPLAGNIPSIRYILVDNSDCIHELAEAAQQDFFQDVSYVVVVCSDITLLKKSYSERGEQYARQQSGAAIQNFLLRITDLGLASCWVGSFVDEMVRKTLQIPEEIIVEAILPVGFEMGVIKKPKSKAREEEKAETPYKSPHIRKAPSLDNILFFNRWKNKMMKEWQKPEAL